MEGRPSSPESVASHCELRPLSPDSPVPHFDIAQIESYDQCLNQRSCTPQSSVSDWDDDHLCLTELFDETRPLSPQSVSSDMELDLLLTRRALSPDSVSSDLDTSLLRDWLLDLRASSPDSAASVGKCSFSPDSMFVQNNRQHCNYYIRYSEDRPVSPLSTLSDVEYSELCVKDLLEESRPESPDSLSSKTVRTESKDLVVAGQPQSCTQPFTYADVVRGFTNEKAADTMSKVMAFESRPVLLLSDSFDEFSDSYTAEFVMEGRPSSPESVASHCELRALSPDSPVPHFDIAQIESYDHCFNQRSCTPQSSISDWDVNDLCLTDLFDETRPLSPQSVSSNMELDLLFSGRALSPDSVSSDLDTSLLRDWLLDLRASSPDSAASVGKCSFSPDSMFVRNNRQHCNYYIRYSEDRPVSPLSTLSDVEYSELCPKDLFDESRPESPDSLSSKTVRTESKDLVVAGQPQSCTQPFTYADVVRGFTNEKAADTVSKVMAFDSGPVLLLSDSFDEFSDSSTAEFVIEERPSSPESVASHCELRPLSPDSPVPHFDIAQIESYDQFFNQRSCTPQSSVSDWDVNDLCLNDLFDETRPLSPQSVSTDMELDLLFSSRALSPDSVSSDLDTSLLRDWLLDLRGSSPDSAASVGKCSLSPDSMFVQNNRQHCNYYIRYSEDRPVSPLSTLSDVEYSELCPKDLFDESRPESPDSLSSKTVRTESKDLVVAGQPQSCTQPFTYADVVRGFTNEKAPDTVSKVMAFDSRPVLLLSDSFDEFSDSSTAKFVMEGRPSSPESVASHCELRALSPDSPVPHFDIAQIQSYDQCFNQRSCTPQSSLSDWDVNDLCLTDLFDETRPLSPQSVSSDMELDLLLISRALSPDSVSSDLDTWLLRDWLLDFRASSPDSVASVEKCSLSPDSMFVQNNRQHCNYYIRYSEDRPVSPLSTLSDVEYSELCPKDLFDESRPESPDSLSSTTVRIENNVSLIAGQPQSCARPFSYADVVRGFTHEKPSDTVSKVMAFESGSVLLLSDSVDEFSDSSTDEFVMEGRPSSPESVASHCELRALSPDSPVPHFDIAQIQSYDQCFNQRSCTPQSSVSDWDVNDLCLTDLFDETRPLSPQSVSSDMELDLLFSSRALSPDSVSSDLNTSLLRDWLLDLRASSSDSAASVGKCSFSPDSMLVQNNRQHCNYYIRYSEDRPVSPLSTLSDVEYSELCVKDLFDESRPEWPDSLSSKTVRRESKDLVVAGQPQSCTQPFTYADVVRGFTHEKPSDTMSEVMAFESRPILLLSDSFDEFSDSSTAEFVMEERPSSPESVASHCELRAFSPDSPVPHFDIAQIESYDQFFNQRSCTPQSSVSDWDDHDLCLTDLFDETRPLSPQSVSSDMELDLLLTSRALSPDSVSSDLDTSLLRDWLLDLRASSPDSAASVGKCSFSPDSMFVQNNRQHCNYYIRYSEDRPVSPLSTLSDVEYSELCPKDLFDESRPELPDSLSPTTVRIENNVSLIAGQPQSCTQSFTYADVVRGFTHEKPSDTMSKVMAFESRPILLLSDSFDEFSESSTAEFVMEGRPSSPESVASHCELRALSPDSPVPHFDIAQIESYEQCFNQRSCTPQSSISDWDVNDLCLTDLFDETRPLSPQSVSSDMELDILFSSRAFSPDSVSSDLDTSLLRDWLLDLRGSSPDSAASVGKCPFSPDSMFVQNNRHQCNYYIRYSEDRPVSPLSDVEYSELCPKDLFDESRPESPDSLSSKTVRTENNVSLIAGQPQSCTQSFTYADVVRGFTHEKPSDTMSKVMAFESRPVLLLSDSFDEFSDSYTAEFVIEGRAYSPDSVASHCELRALSPDSPVPHFDIAQIESYDQLLNQRSCTPQSSISDWDDHDLCLTDLFDETRPLSPQSVSSDMELDILFSGRALSPDSVSSDLDTSLLRDWLLDLRASSPDSAASVGKCSFSADSMFFQNNRQHCNYYIRYSEDRPVSPLSDVEYSELCFKDLFDESRPESPDSLSSETVRTESIVSLIAGQPESCTQPFTYADVVRGFTNEKAPDTVSKVMAFDSGPVLLLSDSFDEFSDSSTAEFVMEGRPSSPESVASHCGLRALSPDSPVPHFDIAQIESYDQCFNQRSCTPQSSLSDWDVNDLCLTDLFDETRPLSPQSVSSDMELDLLLTSRALSPDSVSSDLDTSLLRDWLLDLRASSPDSAASVGKCSFSLDSMFVQNNRQHCNYYIRYSEDRPVSPLSTLSDVEYSELCPKDLFDESRPESPDSLSSKTVRTESKDLVVAGQPQSCTQPFTYADVVRGFTHEKPSDTMSKVMAFESRPILLLFDSFDEFSGSSTAEFVMEGRPSSPESVASHCELRALSPDSPVPHFDIAQIESYDQLFNQRSCTPQSSVSDWDDHDLCLTDLFDETRPLSPQSVSSDRELDLLFSSRAMSPGSVSSDLDMSLLRDWLLDLRASSPDSAASVGKCSFSPDSMFFQNNRQHCNYYIRYSEDRPVSPLSDVEYSELCVKDLLDESRPESPDSLSPTTVRTECKDLVVAGQPQSCTQPFTYADVVRGFTHEKPSDTMSKVMAFESRPILLLSDSFDEFSGSSTAEFVMEERPSSPESVASHCELRALSPDSPVPHFDIAQIESYDQFFNQRSCTPQSSVSDWDVNDLCLNDLFDESRPLSPQSVSTDMELDLLFSSRALSPDSVTSELDTSLLQDWLLDFRASSPDSAASVGKCLISPDSVFVQNNRQHCNYYLTLSEAPLSTLSDVEYTEFCPNYLFDESRPDSPDSVSSDNVVSGNSVLTNAGRQSDVRSPTVADTSFFSPMFNDLHAYRKLISPLLDPFYKGRCSFKTLLKLDAEQQYFYDPQPATPGIAVKTSSEFSLCCFNTTKKNLPDQPSTCLADKFSTPKCPPDCPVFPPKYSSQTAEECNVNESLSQSKKIVHICEPDSHEFVSFDRETDHTMLHRNMTVQSFSDPCLYNLRPPAPAIHDSVECLQHHQSEQCLFDPSIDTDPRLAYKPLHRLMANIYDPVYKGKRYCDTVLLGETAFDKGLEKTSEKSSFECLTATGEEQFLKESSILENTNSIKPHPNEDMTGNNSQPELSHSLSVEENMDIQDTETLSKQTPTRNETMEQRQLLLEHEGTDTVTPIMMTHSQDVLFKDMARQSLRMDKSSFLPISTSSSKTNLSQPKEQKDPDFECFVTNIQSTCCNANTLSENRELPTADIFYQSKTQSEVSLTTETGSSQTTEKDLVFCERSEGFSSMTKDSAQENGEEDIIKPSNSTPTPPASETPQLDFLLSDLEEMKMTKDEKFRSKLPCPSLSQPNDKSSKGNEIYDCKNLQVEVGCTKDNVKVSMQQDKDANKTNVSIARPTHLQTSDQVVTEEVSVDPTIMQSTFAGETSISHTANLPSAEYSKGAHDMSFTSDVGKPVFPKVLEDVPSNMCEESFKSDAVQSQEQEPNVESSEKEETARKSLKETSHMPSQEPTFFARQFSFEELTSCSTSAKFAMSSDETSPLAFVHHLETATSGRQFIFENPMQTDGCSDEARAHSQHLEESLTPIDNDVPDSKPSSVQTKTAMTSFASDEEYTILPGYASTTVAFTHMLPAYEEVVCTSPASEYSDPEPFFDCRQATSDFSETETETEPEKTSSSTKNQLVDDLSCPGEKETVYRQVLLSSGSDDFEDASVVQEDVPIQSQVLFHSGASAEEFTLCELTGSKMRACDDSDSLTRVRPDLVDRTGLAV
ncbi:uncharacterized protein LOC144054843 [Vanacampus margaritifer]